MKIDNLSIVMHNGRRLISRLSFSLNPGDKLAVIGEEGNGKSSLLWALARPEQLNFAKVDGTVYLDRQTLGLMEQQLQPGWHNQTPADYLLKQAPDEVLGYEKYNQLAAIGDILAEVGLAPEVIAADRPLASLSGGEKVKLRLVKLLMAKPDILLLDEPTNDLDLESLVWLEDFIIRQSRPVMYISHDIVFLERTANRILHLENVRGKQSERYSLFHGGYADYVAQRADRVAKQTQVAGWQQRRRREQLIELNDQKNKVRAAQIRIKDSSARRVLNKKMANILAIKQRFDDTERLERPVLEEAIHFVVPEIELPRGKRVLDFKLDKLMIGQRILSGPIELSVMGGEKVCLVGPNGVGKTTLLKRIEEQLRQDDSLTVATFSQTYREEFMAGETAMQYLARHVSDLKQARLQLGSIRLTYEEMERPVLSLSSGQQAKVILAKLVLLGADVILADEPTRNVSPLSAPVIHELFAGYGGSLIMVSHDRRFIERVADRVYQLSPQGLSPIS